MLDNHGDGTGLQPLTFLTATTFELSHVYVDDEMVGDDDLFTVTVFIDDGADVGSDTLIVTVNNVNPNVTASDDVDIVLGNPTGIATFADFTDVGLADTHTATINWGDGTPVESAIVDPVTRTVSSVADHVYATVGDDPVNLGEFTVTITVTDDDGGVHSDSLQVHLEYALDGITDISSPIDNAEYKQGRTIPVNFIITDANGNTVQTTWALPEITLLQNGATPVADCGDGTPFAIFITTAPAHYQCTLKTNNLVAGSDVIISIHLDDGVDPSGTSPAGQVVEVTFDREVSIFIK